MPVYACFSLFAVFISLRFLDDFSAHFQKNEELKKKNEKEKLEIDLRRSMKLVMIAKAIDEKRKKEKKRVRKKE